ncbi:MAG: SRPBCC family protein [Anaerolineales bacterium]|nr:SRPBCC family protein [Anaerolineales bacterium]
MTQLSCKTSIHASADATWQAISSFGEAGQYLSGCVTCAVEGEGIGALRTLTSADGSAIIERLEIRDEVNHKLSYSLLTDTPFHNCQTTMTIRKLAPDQVELEWSATFEPEGIPACEAMEMLEGALSSNCLALKQFMER